MKQCYVLMNHAISEDQFVDLNEMGIEPVMASEQSLKEWANIDPEATEDDIIKLVSDIMINDKVNEYDYVCVQGAFDATMVFKWNSFKKHKWVFPTTKRVVEESVNEDGSVNKKTVFKHIKFRMFSLD